MFVEKNVPMPKFQIARLKRAINPFFDLGL